MENSLPYSLRKQLAPKLIIMKAIAARRPLATSHRTTLRATNRLLAACRFRQSRTPAIIPHSASFKETTRQKPSHLAKRHGSKLNEAQR
jgi:hypothetical protein